jgi:IS4 transposase
VKLKTRLVVKTCSDKNIKKGLPITHRLFVGRVVTSDLGEQVLVDPGRVYRRKIVQWNNFTLRRIVLTHKLSECCLLICDILVLIHRTFSLYRFVLFLTIIVTKSYDSFF